MKYSLRVIIPRNVDIFFQLCKSIIDKHNEDGMNSMLNVLDMEKVKLRYNKAQEKHNLANKNRNLRQVAVQNRNLSLGIDKNQNSNTSNTLNYFIKSIRDTLLGIYLGSEQTLCEWGFEVNASKGKVKVKLSKNQDFLINIAKQILDKHQKDGSNSMLNTFDMISFQNLLNTAITFNDLADSLTKTTKINFQDRHQILGFGNGKRRALHDTLLHDVLSIRNVLLGNFKSNEKTLGDWGFTVDDTPKTKKTSNNNKNKSKKISQKKD